MFFSVVIPTFNRAKLLESALESVFAQEFGDFEVIVVDDGSTDETPELMHAIGEKVRYVRQENRGPGAARNSGIRVASGRYIAFLDSDDAWFPWTLATFARIIGDCDDPPFVSGRGIPWESRSNSLAPPRDPNYTCYPDMLSACDSEVPPVGGTPSIVASTTLLRSIGGFCELPINGEDTDLWLRLAGAGKFVRIQTPPVFVQRYHAGSISNALDASVGGALFLIRQEKAHVYPGGTRFATQRRRIIAATARNVSLDCLKVGRIADAAEIFRESFAWNAMLGRARYLTAFPLVLAQAIARTSRKRAR